MDSRPENALQRQGSGEISLSGLPAGLSLHIESTGSVKAATQGPEIAPGLPRLALPYVQQWISEIRKEHSVPLSLATVLALRGFRAGEHTRRFLAPDVERDLPSPWILPGAVPLCRRIERALADRDAVAICHDYDVDGIMSGVVLARGLRALGLSVSLHSPDRFDDGFGPNAGLSRRVVEQGARLVIWADFGTTHRHAFPVDLFNRADLWVCDHHLPDAHAPLPHGIITNPWLTAEAEEWRPLCAAPLAWNMLRCVFEAAESGEWGLEARARARDFDLHSLLPYVASAAVADVTELQSGNRAMVAEGARRSASCSSPGFQALLARLECPRPNSEDFAFKLGPTLNAKGRICGRDSAGLSAAESISRVLSEDSVEHPARWADDLVRINEYRKQIERQNLNEMRWMLREGGEGVYRNDCGVLVVSPLFNPGVVGLLAARGSDSLGVPMWVLRSMPDGSWKGSARSVEGFHIGNAAQDLSDLCLSVGGHEAAAGATIWAGMGEQFAARFLKKCEEQRDVLPRYRRVAAEFSCSLEFLLTSGETLYRELSPLEPYGRGNPPVYLLVEGFRPTYAKVLKDMHLSLIGDSGGKRANAYFFHCTDHAALTSERYNNHWGEELKPNESAQGARIACRPFRGNLRDDVSGAEPMVLIAAAGC